MPDDVLCPFSSDFDEEYEMGSGMMLPFEEIGRTDGPQIQGLSYFPEFISAEEARHLISRIDSQPWISDLKRRVQHYGYRYDYRTRSIWHDAYLGPLPDWLTPVCLKLTGRPFLEALADQVIVNEYLPGQGIAQHVDCVPCFGPRITILSLGSPCVMTFAQARRSAKRAVVLEDRSLLILSGAARYDWQHGIPARQSDVIDGFRVARRRRVSVTF